MAKSEKNHSQEIRIIGCWLANVALFPNNFAKEGIIRHMLFVFEALLALKAHLQIEIWCIDVNERLLDEILSKRFSNDYKKRIHLCVVPLIYSLHSKEIRRRIPFFQRLLLRLRTHPLIFKYFCLIKRHLIKIPFIKNILVKQRYFHRTPEQLYVSDYINQHSQSDIFYFTFYWGQGVLLRCPKLAIIHDFYTFTHIEKVEKERGKTAVILYNKSVLLAMDHFLCHNSHFVTLTHFVKEQEFNKLVARAKEAKISVIYTPIMLHNKREVTLSKAQLLTKCHLDVSAEYLFYPTEIRGIKNMEVVVRAVHYLRKKYGKELFIVSTGKQRSLPILSALIKKLKMRDYYIESGYLTEEELPAYYKHALMGMAPAFTEGNFPLQAMECLAMRTPVALAWTPIVQDRFAFHNTDPGFMSDFLFNPYDFKALASIILKTLEQGKEKAFAQQEPLLNTLQQYTWRHAAESYYNSLSECMNAYPHRGFSCLRQYV